ncbi:hypothetical protein BSZ35_02435 [Salinibacter sp. 10B]|uniref:DUF3987 domain-containing protein n=1 Tax=Salinibacter sp. 10B TaxID=1923971 RepID=UPI000D2D735C|nr:DUF3987 domain-containing protein [Salinibacter sp. 10B]PQJ33607.1 hypothetical protein BSZ35_02435 [Salinibacter sp. 10B]
MNSPSPSQNGNPSDHEFLANASEEIRKLRDELERARSECADWKARAEELQSQLAEEPAGTADEQRPADTAPLPDVFDDLPAFLPKAGATFEQRRERDVFLTAALPVLAACMPNVRGNYGHIPEPLSPDLFASIVAGAAGGKGAVKWSRRLGAKTDERIRAQSEKAREKWKERKEEHESASEGDDGSDPFSEPKPPKRSLLLPANSSAATFHRGLKDRDERALVVETEIDTLTNALGQEWGKFDDTLRKAYHHEPVSYRRKNEGSVELESPQLSVVLSGTPGQYAELMGTTENGLYSRFAVYYFEDVPMWKSQRPSKSALDARDRFEEVYAEAVSDIHRVLNNRTEPLQFRLSTAQWKLHGKAFRELLHKAVSEGRSHLADVYKRAGLIAFRIAMVLTVLRAHDNGVPLQRADELEAESNDVNTAIDLAARYASHAAAFAEDHLDGEVPPDASGRRIAVMLEGVDDRFSSGEAYTAAGENGIQVTDKTLRKDLERAERQGLIQRLTDNGRWEKVGTDAVSDSSDSSDPTKKP